MLAEKTSNLLYLFFIACCIILPFLFFKKTSKNISEESDTKNKLSTALLIFALLFGVFIRFYGIDFGLPTPYHPDELQKARLVKNMMATGSLNPNFHALPPFLLYLSWGMEKVVSFFDFYPDNKIIRILFSGRLVNAFCGSFSILILFLIGRNLYGKFSGALAAFLLAISPLHVTNSRYMKEDALFLTFVLICAYFVIRVINEKKIYFLYLASFFAGIAFGAKYTGSVTIIMVLAVPWLVRDRLTIKPNLYFLKHTIFSLILLPVGLFLTLPYAIGDYEAFTDIINGLAKESKHAMRGHQGLAISAFSQYWMYHFSRSIIPGLGWIIVFSALFSLGLALKKKEVKSLWVFGIVLLFYLPAEWAQSKPPPQPDRYVIACLPFLILLATVLIEKTLSTKKLYLLISIIILSIQPLAKTIALATEIKHDTREQMTDWMRKSFPEGTKILIAGEKTYLPVIPRKFRTKSLRKVRSKDRAKIIEEIKSSGYQYLLITNLTNPRFKVEAQNESRKAKTLRMIEANFILIKEINSQQGPNGFHNPALKLYQIKP